MVRKLSLWLAIAVGLCAPLALAQTITNRSITGTNTLNTSIGGPGGQTQATTVAQLRNAQGVVTTALTTGTLSNLTTSTASLISTAASVSLTVNLPARPFDGEIFEWVNGSGGAFTAGTVAVIDGSTIVNGTAAGTLAAGASIEYRYVLATNSWYKIR